MTRLSDYVVSKVCFDPGSHGRTASSPTPPCIPRAPPPPHHVQQPSKADATLIFGNDTWWCVASASQTTARATRVVRSSGPECGELAAEAQVPHVFPCQSRQSADFGPEPVSHVNGDVHFGYTDELRSGLRRLARGMCDAFRLSSLSVPLIHVPPVYLSYIALPLFRFQGLRLP